jgi:hypothetical protein
MDCSSASEADRVWEWEAGVQCPNDRKPIFFMALPCETVTRAADPSGRRAFHQRI